MKAQRIEPVGPGLPLAGHGISQWPTTRKPVAASRMARLPPAGRPRRLAPGAGRALAFPNKNIIPDHTVPGCVETSRWRARTTPVPAIRDFPRFARMSSAGSRPTWWVRRRRAAPGSLEVTLTEYNETLRPTYAVRDPESKAEGQSPWMMLVQVLPARDLDLDDVTETDRHRWQASPQARFERLLRDPHDPVPIGLLVQRHVPAPGLRPARRELGPPDLPRPGHDRSRRPADLRRAAHAARRADGSSRSPTSSGCRPSSPRAGSTRTSSRRSSPSRCWPRSTSCSAASRRPTTSGKASCSATCSQDDPNQVYAGLLTRPLAAGVPALRRGPGAALESTRSTRTITRSPACSSGSAPTPAAIPTRWTSASAPGPSS